MSAGDIRAGGAFVELYADSKKLALGLKATGVACAASGRKFIGIEKEKKYFDIACKRIKEEYEKTDVSSAGLVCGLADES